MDRTADSPQRSQWRKAMHFLLFCVLASSWSVMLFQAAADREYEPFRSLVYRSRVAHFYRQHAPNKVDNVPKIMKKNKGKEEELLASLSRKYDSTAAPLEVTSLALTCAQALYESLATGARRRQLEGFWEAWHAVPVAQQFLVATTTALAIVSGGGVARFAASPESRGASFFFYEVVLLVLLLRPSPFSRPALCSPGNLWATVAALVASVVDGSAAAGAKTSALGALLGDSERGPLVFVSLLAVVLMYLREKRARRGVLIAWLAALLVLTNPARGYENPNGGVDFTGGDAKAKDDPTVIAALDAIAAKAQSGRKLFQRLPEGSVAVVDLGLLSVATWSKTNTHSWLSPVLAVGVADAWRGAVEASVVPGGGKGGKQSYNLKMKGRAMLPAWSVPATVFLTVWALMHLPI